MKNNKGFVLVETLVVTVFVVTVFTMLFVQYTPALSEFERREYSDDIDSKYDIYWVKMMVQSQDYITDAKWTTIKNRLYSSSGNTPYVELTHDYFTDYPDCTVGTAQCIIDKVKYDFDIDKIYVTKYSLSGNNLHYKKINNRDVNQGGFFKDKLLEGTHGKIGGTTFDPGLVEYVDHLPDYINMSMNYAEFRLIAQFKRLIDPNLATGGAGTGTLDRSDANTYYTYATIEVIRE